MTNDYFFRNTVYHCKSRKGKSFGITLEIMADICKLPKGSADLLMNLLKRVRPKCSEDAVIISASYDELGYDNRNIYYRHRDKLRKEGFINFEGNDHVINPYAIDYLNKNQKDYFRELYGYKDNLIPKSFSGNSNK